MSSSLRYRALRQVGIANADLTSLLHRVAAASQRFVGAALHEVMEPRERERLSMELYSRSTQRHEAHRGLPSWEAAWFERDLPPAGSSLLIAAAGTGREALPLLERGYKLTAFDGAESAVRIFDEAVGARAKCVLGTYQEFCDAVEGQASPLSSLVATTYDGVLLGWGSLAHVAGRSERRRVLEAACSLTKGPVLASFYVADATARPDRATRWGRAFAQRFADGRDEREQATFYVWGGFAELLTRGEVAALAASVGRNVRYEERGAPFPYVTFFPPLESSVT